jgi:hypothetical protein
MKTVLKVLLKIKNQGRWQWFKPEISGGREWETQGSRPVEGGTFERPHLKQWLGVVVCACHSSYSGSTNRRIVVQVGLGLK